jgi:hypothetical protein
MKKDERAVHLTASEFLASGRNGLNQQVASARWQLLLALRRKVPEFFEQLRDEVYPAFARLAKPGYWHTGFSFSMWQSRSDRDRELTPILMKWAPDASDPLLGCGGCFCSHTLSLSDRRNLSMDRPLDVNACHQWRTWWTA